MCINVHSAQCLKTGISCSLFISTILLYLPAPHILPVRDTYLLVIGLYSETLILCFCRSRFHVLYALFFWSLPNVHNNKVIFSWILRCRLYGSTKVTLHFPSPNYRIYLILCIIVFFSEFLLVVARCS